jgi:membrane protein
MNELHRHGGEAAQLAAPPSWVILVSAALVAAGVAVRASPAAAKDRALREVRDPSAPAATPAPDRGASEPDRGRSERGRGRSAERPSEIPWRGWKDVLLRLYHRVSRDRILLIAAGVTFYLILAIFPAIAALVSIYGLFFDPKTLVNHLDVMARIAPGGAIEVLRDQLTRLGRQSGTALGWGFFIGLAVSLWSATSGVKAIFDGLNVAYEEDEKRSFINLTAMALLFTAGLIVFVIVAIAAVVALPVALNFLAVPGLTNILLKIARWPVLFAIVALALSVFYRYGPSRAEPKWRWITWGSVVATLLWGVASILFSWYVASFGSYNKTYGSLGAIIGFMTWVWLSVSVVLAGAQLNAEIEHQSARQTTSGPPQPLGSRGATMADTIGAAQS